jgi:hypothetical protein
MIPGAVRAYKAKDHFLLARAHFISKTSSFSISLGQRSIVDLFAHGSLERLSRSKRACNNVFKAGNFSQGSVLNGYVYHDVVPIREPSHLSQTLFCWKLESMCASIEKALP